MESTIKSGAASSALTSASPEPDISNLPRYVDRKSGAALVTRYFFPVSHRTLERWPLTGRIVNGRLVFATADLFAHARAMMDAAPSIKSGPASLRTLLGASA